MTEVFLPPILNFVHLPHPGPILSENFAKCNLFNRYVHCMGYRDDKVCDEVKCILVHYTF